MHNSTHPQDKQYEYIGEQLVNLETGEVVYNRGLSNSNKVHEDAKKHGVLIRNSETGEEFIVDKHAARLSRMRKRVFSWANTVKDYLPNVGQGRNYRKVMITLTYRGVDDWRANHIRDYIKALRRKLDTRLIAYAWCAELQGRGAVHYHLILVVLKGTHIPKPDSSGMWPFGMSQIATAKTVFYIASYMKKEYQKSGVFPKGLRMFAVWIAPGVISDLARWLHKLSSLPNWLISIIRRLTDNYGSKWSRNPGGGWLYADKIYHSPFFMVGFA